MNTYFCRFECWTTCRPGCLRDFFSQSLFCRLDFSFPDVQLNFPHSVPLDSLDSFNDARNILLNEEDLILEKLVKILYCLNCINSVTKGTSIRCRTKTRLKELLGSADSDAGEKKLWKVNETVNSNSDSSNHFLQVKKLWKENEMVNRNSDSSNHLP